MSYLQKNTFAHVFSSILVFGVYYWRIISMFQAGRFDGSDATSLLGKSILLLIAGGIVVTIIVTIAFNILVSIATDEQKPSYVVDERDRLIELRGTRASEVVTGIGFVVAMAALALGHTPFVVFNMIVFGFASGNVTGSVLRLLLYRRGF